MNKWVWITLIAVAVLAVVGVLIWGESTNWGKSMTDADATTYCYSLCVKGDMVNYCLPNLIIHFTAGNSPFYGSTDKDVNCKFLEMNRIITPCPSISCP
jgi:hypothetical protein